VHVKEFSLTEKLAPSIDTSVGSWVLSSSAYDRVNDRVMPDALHKHVGKDIICLWQHSADQPIGRWANVRMKGEKLVGDLVLAKTNLGQMISALLDVKTPLGASIGFKGSGKKNEKGGWDFIDASIFETSVVSVPCNAEAMQIAKHFNIELPVEPVQALNQNVAVSGEVKAAIRRANLAVLAVNRSIRK